MPEKWHPREKCAERVGVSDRKHSKNQQKSFFDVLMKTNSKKVRNLLEFLLAGTGWDWAGKWHIYVIIDFFSLEILNEFARKVTPWSLYVQNELEVLIESIRKISTKFFFWCFGEKKFFRKKFDFFFGISSGWDWLGLDWLCWDWAGTSSEKSHFAHNFPTRSNYAVQFCGTNRIFLADAFTYLFCAFRTFLRRVTTGYNGLHNVLQRFYT